MEHAPVVALQLGLFGQSPVIVGYHRVSAHVRVLSTGHEVFVGEHLRVDRGRVGPRLRPVSLPVPAPADDAQQELFASDAERDAHLMEEVELLPGAWQQPLWRR
ncbi:MAG: hypothetical protein KTR31_21960 [Myxococcales bacterium]|nr:hypothetical protein [Myxococcales bacterium]